MKITERKMKNTPLGWLYTCYTCLVIIGIKINGRFVEFHTTIELISLEYH